jgi:hypothetical protein
VAARIKITTSHLTCYSSDHSIQTNLCPYEICFLLVLYSSDFEMVVWDLKRIQMKILSTTKFYNFDKIGAKLPGWKGRLLSTVGRETLVKTVLSSQPIYHLTAFPEQKWLIKRINRLRRNFLRGETPDKFYGGHSIINWSTTCLPKVKGGLGVLDLEHFARALRLRWLWFQWR